MSFDPRIIWPIAGLVLLAAELVLPGIYLLWIAVAAFAAGLLALAVPGLPLAVQLLAFAGTGALLAFLAATGRLPAHGLRGRATVNTDDAGLVGRACTAIEPLAPGRPGRVALGDGSWTAELADGAPAVAQGAALRVVALEGTRLRVAPGG
jgi:hypothetical protein